jgi:phosphate transport system protein
LAVKVCRDDDEVDRLKRDIARQLRDAIRLQPDELKMHLKLMDVSRHLERLADLATNIAEDVIYFVRGEIVRHRRPAEEEPA